MQRRKTFYQLRVQEKCAKMAIEDSEIEQTVSNPPSQSGLSELSCASF